MSQSTEKKSRWYQSPWIMFGIILLLVFIIVSSYRIMLAFQNNPGLVVSDSYEKGQDYEKNYLTKLKNNEKWKARFDVPALHENQPGKITVTILDRQGQYEDGIEQVTLFAYRPADARKDFSVPMTYQEETNTYLADITFKNKGVWELLASAVINGVEVNYPKRIFVNDPQ